MATVFRAITGCVVSTAILGVSIVSPFSFFSTKVKATKDGTNNPSDLSGTSHCARVLPVLLDW